jgi:hypothetical protein
MGRCLVAVGIHLVDVEILVNPITEQPKAFGILCGAKIFSSLMNWFAFFVEM